MFSLLKKLGPGLIFAGAAIGVSHLVQATKAGATFGTGLLWPMFFVTLFKYPTFQFGTRYASETKESLLHGYQRVGKWVLPVYVLLNFATMFTIQTAVTIVTAGIAGSLFNLYIDIKLWSVLLLFLSTIVLLLGKYSFFDKFVKIVVICLSLATLIAVFFALGNNGVRLEWYQQFPVSAVEITFLITFMGWMPAPLDVSVWQSLWTQEKQKITTNYTFKTALFDFNIGYIGTFFIGICFLLMGALVMYKSDVTFSNSGVAFADQFLSMYTKSLGGFAYFFIGVAAFTCMFSTTLTTLDASPRAMTTALELLGYKHKKSYLAWVLILGLGTAYILFFQISEMGVLIKIATIVSFLTAPFYAILNHVLVFGNYISAQAKPNKYMKFLSIFGICFLIAFGVWYLFVLGSG